MTRDWKIPGFLLDLVLVACLLVIGTIAAGSPNAVKADINEDAHLGGIDWDEDEEERGPKWITRNLIDGNPIRVCTDDYLDTTKQAVDRWNDALRLTAFTVFDDPDDCDTDDPGIAQNGALSLTVSRGEWMGQNADGRPVYEGQILHRPRCPGLGCAGFEYTNTSNPAQPNTMWQSYHGRAEIIMHPMYMWDDVQWVQLLNVLTHELGHILALVDYFCHAPGYADDGIDVSQHPDRIEPHDRMNYPDPQTIMNSLMWRGECNSPNGWPTTRDRRDYRAIYTPATVVVEGPGIEKPEVDGQTVTLHWSQADVFVESDFEIQRKNGKTWEVEEIVDPNEETITLTNQPGGVQHYRVRARTLALCPDDADCRQERKHFYGDPSNEIEVPVQLVAPSVSTIRSSDITTNRVTLRWSEVPGANGYEVKRTDGSKETDAESLPGTARSHPFGGLSPNTPYTFYVRATLSSRSDLASAWAPAGARTKPAPLQLKVTPKQNSCESGESIDIDWEVEGGRSPYSVSFRDTNGNTTLVTFHSSVTSGSGSVSCQSTPVTVTVTDAAAVPVSVNKTVSWTATVPDITPTETFTLRAEISSNSCYITERVTVTWSTQNDSNDVTLTVSTRGTTVTFDYSDRTPSPITVYCRPTAGPQEIVVSAQDSTGASASSTFNVDVKEAQSLVECLPYTGYGGTAVFYRGSVCLGATASALWNGLASANIAVGCITKWDSSSGSWLAYQSGRADFNLGIRALLILGRSACQIDDDVSGASAEGPLACPDAAPAASGPRIVRVGEASCVVVRGGGAAQVSDGSHTLNLTLPAGRDWALFASSGLEGDDAGIFWFLDLTTGGWVALNPADGAELARHAPADADGLPALLDAIAASASAPAAE